MHPARQGRWLRIEILYLEEPRFISLMKGSHEIFANMNLLNLVKKQLEAAFMTPQNSVTRFKLSLL